MYVCKYVYTVHEIWYVKLYIYDKYTQKYVFIENGIHNRVYHDSRVNMCCMVLLLSN